MVAALASAGASAQDEPDVSVRVHVQNPAAVRQDRVVAASVPFARGALKLPASDGPFAVEVFDESSDGEVQPLTSHLWPARPLVRWPDGSAAVLSVHVRLDVLPHAARTIVVKPRVAEGQAETLPPPVATTEAVARERAAPVIWTELVDPWGRTLKAELVPDETAGKDGLLSDSGVVRIRRFRSTHRIRAGEAAGSPLLDLRAWLVTVVGDRRAELTLALDNDEPMAGPLGPVRFSSFRVCFGDPQLRFVPAFAREQSLPPPTVRKDGVVVQELLRTGHHYLGDGTAKLFRLHLFADADELTPDQRAAAQWAPVRLVALPDLDAVRRTRAFSAYGGPAPLFGADQGDDGQQVAIWRQSARLGPWGGFGEPEDPRLGGGPRHGDSLLHNVVRWQSAPLLGLAEAMVLQHTLRPTGGRSPRLPDDTAAYRAGLREQTFSVPHGRPRLDYEHCSAQLLFDYWWLTGDEVARDELRRTGASVVRMLASAKFRTGRGEGRCLEAGALCAMATGDATLARSLLDHALNVLPKSLATDGHLSVLPQPSHPLVLDGADRFDATSQMAALLRGLAALHRATEAPELVPMVARIADVMATSAWLDGVGPKTFVSATDRGRYSFAALPEDRSGSDRTLIGAFLLAASLVDDPERSGLWRQRAEVLFEREVPATAGVPVRLLAAANPWLQIALDRRKLP